MGCTFPKVSSSYAGNSVTRKAVTLAQLRSQVWEDHEGWTGIQRKHLFLRNYSVSCTRVKGEMRVIFTYQISTSFVSEWDHQELWPKNTFLERKASWTSVSCRLLNPKAAAESHIPLLVGHTKPLRPRSSISHPYVQFKLTQSKIQQLLKLTNNEVLFLLYFVHLRGVACLVLWQKSKPYFIWSRSSSS